MYKLLYLILPVLFFACTNHSIDPDEINDSSGIVVLNDSLKAVLYSDAQNLEYEQMKKNENIFNTNPWLDEENVQKYFNDFITIYSTMLKSNPVFARYSPYMHFPDSKYLTQGLMAVDTSKTWVQNWLNGKQESGVEAIDKIIKQFNLKIEIWNSWSRSHYDFFLLAPYPMNLNVPIQQLENTNEFRWVERNYAFSSIPNPELVRDGSTRTYIFSYGWGDCPSGCIYMHHWQIKVNDNKVTSVFEYGEPIEL